MKFKYQPKDISPESIAAGLAAGFKKAFGRSFKTQVSEKDGKIVVVATEADNGQSVMTVEDVSALMQIPRESVMERTRDARHPLPHFWVGTKIVRFKRVDVIAWIDEAVTRGAVPKILPPAKGKIIGRKR